VAADDKPGFAARTAGSSRVVSALRRLTQGSVVWGVLVRIGRSFSGRSSWIAAQMAKHPPSRDFPYAMQVVKTSRLLGAIDRVFIAFGRAWEASAVKRIVIVDSGILETDTSQRVRLIGIAIVVAAVTHAVLAYSTLFQGWRAPLAWLVVLGVGGIMIAGSKSIAVAWRHWRRPAANERSE